MEVSIEVSIEDAHLHRVVSIANAHLN